MEGKSLGEAIRASQCHSHFIKFWQREPAGSFIAFSCHYSTKNVQASEHCSIAKFKCDQPGYEGHSGLRGGGDILAADGQPLFFRGGARCCYESD